MSKGLCDDYDEEEGRNVNIKIYQPPENRGGEAGVAPTASADVYRYTNVNFECGSYCIHMGLLVTLNG